MIVIPMKLMPYLLVIGGVYGVFSGKDVAWGIVMTAAGGAWLYFRRKAITNQQDKEEEPCPEAQAQIIDSSEPKESSDRKPVDTMATFSFENIAK